MALAVAMSSAAYGVVMVEKEWGFAVARGEWELSA